MGLTLTNEQIDLTYQGLIKTTDNTGITTVLKPLTDGIGTNLPMEISTTGVNFTGTVTGISAGGLIAGTGSNSMKSADFLTSGAGQASANNTICIGNGGIADGSEAIYIGSGGQASTDSIGIGQGAVAVAGPAIAIGRNARAVGSVALAIGNSATVNASQSIGLSGENCNVTGTRSVAIGRQVSVTANNTVAIGNYTVVNGPGSISMMTCQTSPGSVNSAGTLHLVPGAHGCTTNAAAIDAIVLGSAATNSERATAIALRGVAIGYDTVVNAADAVALGSGVVATIANTVSVKEIETQTIGGGITMYSPNGTGYKLTVSDAGAPVFTAI